MTADATPRRLTGLYPGTFDPITLGHKDIILRALRVVDRLVIAVAENEDKGPLFSTTQRVEMIEAEMAECLNKDVEIEVCSFSHLLMHLAEEKGAQVIIRGLRAVSDFEYEFQMASMNARLNGEVETVFLTASERQQFIASRFVKEIARLGGDVSSFVSPQVLACLKARFAELEGA